MSDIREKLTNLLMAWEGRTITGDTRPTPDALADQIVALLKENRWAELEEDQKLPELIGTRVGDSMLEEQIRVSISRRIQLDMLKDHWRKVKK